MINGNNITYSGMNGLNSIYASTVDTYDVNNEEITNLAGSTSNIQQQINNIITTSGIIYNIQNYYTASGIIFDNFVDKLNDQTILGIKTFSNPIYLKTVYFNSDLSNNITIGLKPNNLGGINNTICGFNSGGLLTSGSTNALFGHSSGRAITTGSANVSVGAQSLFNNTTGTGNNSIGRNALYNNTTGTGNVGIGSTTLFLNTTTIYNTAIGNNSFNGANTFSYSTSIGAYSMPTASRQVVLGTILEHVLIPNYILYSDGTTQNTSFLSYTNSISGSLYNLSNRKYNIGTVSNLVSGNNPYVILNQDTSGNIIFDFGLVSGSIGPTGLIGLTGPIGKTGADGKNGMSSAGSEILTAFISIIVSVCISVATELILGALGASSLSALTAQIAYLDFLTFELRGELTIAEEAIIELEANQAIMLSQIETMQTQIEQIQAKILYVSCVPDIPVRTSIDSVLTIYSPLQTNKIYGNVEVYGNFAVKNANILEDGLAQFT